MILTPSPQSQTPLNGPKMSQTCVNPRLPTASAACLIFWALLGGRNEKSLFHGIPIIANSCQPMHCTLLLQGRVPNGKSPPSCEWLEIRLPSFNGKIINRDSHSLLQNLKIEITLFNWKSPIKIYHTARKIIMEMEHDGTPLSASKIKGYTDVHSMAPSQPQTPIHCMCFEMLRGFVEPQVPGSGGASVPCWDQAPAIPWRIETKISTANLRLFLLQIASTLVLLKVKGSVSLAEISPLAAQPEVKWWFWFVRILELFKSDNLFQKGIPGMQTTDHQLCSPPVQTPQPDRVWLNNGASMGP